MLPDRDHSAIAGQQVPRERNSKQRKDLDQQPLSGEIRVPWQKPKKDNYRDQGDRQPPGEPPEFRAAAISLDQQHDWFAHRACLLKKPLGRASSSNRNIRCPKNGPRPDEIRAPNSCATPITSPPARVPHRLPRPPSTTASNE